MNFFCSTEPDLKSIKRISKNKKVSMAWIVISNCQKIGFPKTYAFSFGLVCSAYKNSRVTKNGAAIEQ